MKLTPMVYAVQMNPFTTIEEELERIQQWSSHVPVMRAQRIARFRKWQDQWRSLAGDMLVRYVLREKYRLISQQMNFSRNKYNKPILVDNDVHYNVSHSGIWVVAAFHSEPIGIDIEQIDKADMQIAEAMFARSEYEALCNKPVHKRDHFFYEIWTGKESYVKADGRGLNIPLDSFCVASSITDGVCVAIETTSSTSWRLRQYDLHPDYKLTVCSESVQWTDQVLVLEAAQLQQ